MTLKKCRKKRAKSGSVGPRRCFSDGAPGVLARPPHCWSFAVIPSEGESNVPGLLFCFAPESARNSNVSQGGKRARCGSGSAQTTDIQDGSIGSTPAD